MVVCFALCLDMCFGYTESFVVFFLEAYGVVIERLVPVGIPVRELFILSCAYLFYY